jgi:dTDP-4-dehydrorhamnose 3,5-epimerase
MIFRETALKGAFIIEPELLEDQRGFFTRTFCQKEFEDHGLDSNILQCNLSFNAQKGTLRGMHYQASPAEEIKLVRVTKGSIYDVIIDMRPDSPSFKQWLGVELTAENRKMLYVPAGFAHGFKTLANNTEVYYQMSVFYQPGYARGVLWNDPSFGITWPEGKPILSPKDSQYPLFTS